MVNVSEDIIFGQIITRLPVKTIVRFRCVSMLWNRFLSNPDQEFISSHISYTSQNPDYECLLMCTRKDFNYTGLNQSIDILAHSRLSYTRIEYPPLHLRSIVGCVNGLVCLTWRGIFLLWNPVTSLGKTIVPPQHYSKFTKLFFGLGWNYVENDFKLVSCYVDGKSSLPCVVYSSNFDSWTPLLIPPSLDLFTSSCKPYTIVKGCPYWYNMRYTFKFEIQSNQFKKFLLPHPTAMVGYRFLLSNSNDTLIGMSYTLAAISTVDVHHLDEEFGVWSKRCTVGPIDCYLRPLSQCFKYSGEIVFDNAKRLYDPKTNGIKVIGDGPWNFNSGFSYTPSLVVLQGMESLHKQSHWRSGEEGRQELRQRLAFTPSQSRRKLLIRIARKFLCCFLCWNND